MIFAVRMVVRVMYVIVFVPFFFSWTMSALDRKSLSNSSYLLFIHLNNLNKIQPIT